MDIANTVKFGSRELNAVLRIARLVMKMASEEDFFDLELDGRTGMVIVKKWKRTPTGAGDELEIVYKMTWRPGVYHTVNGYHALKDIQKWLEQEKASHTEADLSLGGEGREE